MSQPFLKQAYKKEQDVNDLTKKPEAPTRIKGIGFHYLHILRKTKYIMEFFDLFPQEIYQFTLIVDDCNPCV